MRLLSPLSVLAVALLLGATFSGLMGGGAKVEAESGLLVAHLPMFVLGTGLSWFALMLLRKFLMSKVSVNG